MKRPRLLRIVALLFLAVLGVFLYADLQSIHQIFRVSEKMISDAPTPQARQALIENKKTRDREEQRHKTFVEAALIVDVVLFLGVAASDVLWLNRSSKSTI